MARLRCLVEDDDDNPTVAIVMICCPMLLDEEQCDRTMQHLVRLWGYRVKLIEVNSQMAKTLKEHEAPPMP